MVYCALARAEKGVLDWHPPAAAGISHLDFPIESQQTHGAVGARQRMGHIARQGAHVAHLWSAYYAAAFGQASTVLEDTVVLDNLAMRYCATDHDVPIIERDVVQAGDPAGIYQCVHWWLQALLHFQQQICSTADHTRPAVVGFEQFDRFLKRFWRMVVFPTDFDGVFLLWVCVSGPTVSTRA
jgi:hypothetical protein